MYVKKEMKRLLKPCGNKADALNVSVPCLLAEALRKYLKLRAGFLFLPGNNIKTRK
jgi:hypothetical protein